MKISYDHRPTEGQPFSFIASGIDGAARFRAFLDGALFWEEECDDPPCHEELRLPDGIAGKTLLLQVADGRAKEELFFFIDDEGLGRPIKPHALTPENA